MKTTSAPIRTLAVVTRPLSGRLTGHAQLYHYSLNPVINYRPAILPLQICLN